MKNCKIQHIKERTVLFEAIIEKAEIITNISVLRFYLKNEKETEVIDIDLSKLELNSFQKGILSNFLK